MVGIAGVWVAAITSSQAILLDGIFNLVYFVMSLLSLKVSRLVQRPDDEKFPFGYAYFEPLMNGTKGLLIVGVSVIAFVGAVDALLRGGRDIAVGAAVGYAVFAAAIGWGTAGLQAYFSRRSVSPLVATDVKNWIVNGAVSSVVGLAFGTVFVIRGSAAGFLAPYVDPGLVAGVILVTIPVPVTMVWSSLMEMLNAAPDRETVARVEAAVSRAASPLAPRASVVRVLRVGRQLYALVHLVVDAGPGRDLKGLDENRQRMTEQLQADAPGLAVDFVFTGDERWVLPVATRPG
jgi:predicted Co/Zn/Cd cation transporter (cation efflux family)